MIPFHLPIVLWGVRGIAYVPYSQFFQELRKPRSEFYSAIRPDSPYPKRAQTYEIPNELHTRSHAVFRMKPREYEPGTIVHCVVLGFSSRIPERETGVHLYFSPGDVERVERLSLRLPFSLPFVADACSPEYPEYRGLIENDSGLFFELHNEKSRSEFRIRSGDASYQVFRNRIGPICRDSGLRSALLGNHSGLSLNPVPGKPFGYRLAGDGKERGCLSNAPDSRNDFFQKFDSHLYHGKTEISWSHG